MHNNHQSKERTFGRPLKNTSVPPKEQVLMLMKTPKPIISLNMLRIFRKQFDMQKLTLDTLQQVIIRRLLSKSIELSYNKSSFAHHSITFLNGYDRVNLFWNQIQSSLCLPAMINLIKLSVA